MNIKAFLLATFLSFGMVGMTAPSAKAKAYFASNREMIANADAIAVVNVTRVNAIKKKGRTWEYGQEAEAKLEKLIKGDLPAKFSMFGAENFICARTSYVQGRALVFLSSDGDMYTSSNWQLGVRPIKEGKVPWDEADNRFDQKLVALDDVVKQIEAAVGRKADLDRLPTYLRTLASAKSLDDGTQGESNQPSAQYLAFQTASKTVAQDRSHLDVILRQGTSAGKIYAAMLLQKVDPAAAKEALILLARSRSVVMYRSGCAVTQQATAQIANELLSNGKYLGLSIK